MEPRSLSIEDDSFAHLKSLGLFAEMEGESKGVKGGETHSNGPSS